MTLGRVAHEATQCPSLLRVDSVQSMTKTHREKTSIFVNCSNHPTEAWSDAQRHAIDSMGYAQIIDLSFPQVDPFATTEEVDSLAADLIGEILRQAPEAAFVSGESSVAATVIRLDFFSPLSGV